MIPENVNVYFCSFANSRLQPALNRIEKQAESFKIFKKIFIYNENDLDVSFKKRYQSYLRDDCRGYGYWCWKPYIVLETMKRMHNGDILLYCDAGCHLNNKGLSKFEEYLNIVNESSTGRLAFLQNHLEKSYTKGDLFDYFSVRNNTKIVETGQIAATIFFMRKSDQNIIFLEKWLEVWNADFSLLDDTESKSNNFNEYIAHRHDQSAFSILAKMNGCELLPSSEIWSTDWTQMRNYPLLAKRDKAEKLSYKFLRLFKRSFRS